MAKYLSIDTEATGLEEDTHLIQLAFVPVDSNAPSVNRDLGVEYLVKCPSFESLAPKLNEWVLEHNTELIKKAHAEGIDHKALREAVAKYLDRKEIKDFFGSERPPLLGKSLSALDIPLLTKHLGRNFMNERFHHHTLDITCAARALADSGILPPGCYTTTKLMRHFKIREQASHTALCDAVDMGEIYIRLVEMLKRFPP